jgi:hypothetical protein
MTSQTTPIELEMENLRFRRALEKISEGRGRFSMDHLQHAKNTIEDAINTAKKALAGDDTDDE